MRLLLALLAALLLVPAAQALVVASPSRFDPGTLAPGDAFEGVVRVTNKGAEPTRVEVRVTTFEGEQVEAEPRALALAPAESREVRVRVALPANASGGRHDPRVELVETTTEDEGATMGRAAVSVPVVFWVRNLKVGNLEVRHPLAGEDGEARILVQNFLGEPVEADVALRVLDASGAEVARGVAKTASTAANASASLNVTLPTAGLAPGSYVVRGEASRDAFGSNAWQLPLFVGERRLGVGESAAEVLADGRVRFTARVTNLGTVPLPAIVTFEYGLRGQPSRSVSADGGMLEPGASRLLRAETAALPGGAYGSTAAAYWPGGSAEATDVAFSIAPAATAQARTPVSPALACVGLLVAVLLWRRR